MEAGVIEAGPPAAGRTDGRTERGGAIETGRPAAGIGAASGIVLGLWSECGGRSPVISSSNSFARAAGGRIVVGREEDAGGTAGEDFAATSSFATTSLVSSRPGRFVKGSMNLW